MKQQAFIEVLAFVPLVTESQRDHWERFATYAAPSWILWESQEQQSHQQSPSQQQPHPTIPARIYQQVNQTNDDPILLPPSNDDNNNNITVNDNYYYAPLWQVSPPPPPKFNKRINVDLFSTQPPLQLATMFQAANRTDFITVSNILDLDWYNDSLHDLLFWGNDSSIHSDHDHEKGAANANANANANQTLGVPIIRSERSPKSVFLQPVYDNFFDEKEEPFDISDNSNNNTLVRQIKGFTLGVLRWEQFYKDLLPLNNDDSDNDDSDNAAAAAAGVHAVLKNTCGQTMTFLIHGPSATFVGVDDLHERRFDDLVVETDLEEFASPQHRHHDKDGDDLHQQGNTCYYHMSLYPSAQFRSAYQTKKTENFTLGMASIFVVTGIAFWIFIYLSKRRQRKVLAVAISSNNIVRSMFPKNVSQIILRDAEEEALRHLEEGDNKRKRYYRRRKKKQHQKSKNTNNFRDDDDENDENYGSHEFTTSGLLSASTHRSSSSLFRSSRPIADLYPEVTVMFADIVGKYNVLFCLDECIIYAYAYHDTQISNLLTLS